MPELFVAMLKEEWRIHSTIFGSISFALFPVLILGIALMGSLLVPLMEPELPPGALPLLAHATFLMLGLMVGAFGLLGNEAMNRRFGQASLLASSARNLPLPDRSIFVTFVAKDIVYYFVLWVLPFGSGCLAAALFSGGALSRALLLFLTLSLAFLFGLGLTFALSSLSARSGTGVWLLAAILAAGWGAIQIVTGTSPVLLFPPLLLYSSFSWETLLISCAVLTLLFTLSVALFSPGSTAATTEAANRFSPLLTWFSSFPHPALAAKDMLDLCRSGSLAGQTLFSFVFPLAVIWFFLALLSPFFPPYGLLFTFAILTGVIASTMYTWITMFDTFGPYACLPVSPGMLIQSKITTFSVLQIIPAGFIAAAAVLAGEAAVLIPAVVLCLAVSFYSLGVTVWLTGLSPGVLIYDARVLLSSLVLIGVAVTVIAGVAFAGPYHALASILLAIPAWLFLRRAIARWDAVDQAAF